MTGTKRGLRLPLLITVLLLAALAVRWRFAANDSALAGYLQGAALAQKGKDAEAIALWEPIRRSNPSLPDVNVQLVRAYLRQGDPAHAVACAQELVQRHPEYPEAYTLLSTALLRAGDVPGALQAGKTAVGHAPDNASAHFTLCAAYARYPQFKECEQELLTAERLAPGEAEYWQTGATFYKENRMAVQCQAQVQRLVALAPTSWEAHYLLGWALAQETSVSRPKAILALQQAFTLNPQEPQAPSLLGHILVEQHDFAKAVSPLETARALLLRADATLSPSPNRTQARAQIAHDLLLAYGVLGDAKRAAAMRTEARTLSAAAKH